jgi:hypothetical protein
MTLIFSKSSFSEDNLDKRLINEVGENVGVELGKVFSKDLIVFIAFGLDCPIMRTHLPILKDIILRYSDKNVSFMLINAVKNSDAKSILEFKKNYELGFPIYNDAENSLLKTLRFTTLSQAVIYQRSTQSVIYSGAISNQFTFDLSRKVATKKYLENALDSALANKKIKVPSSKIFGCSITL